MLSRKRISEISFPSSAMAGDVEVKDFFEMPGPWGIPILGSALTLGSAHPRKFIDWAANYYGNIFRYKMVYQEYVVLNGLEALEEALQLNGKEVSGRMQNVVTDYLFKGKGLFFTDYGQNFQRWKNFAIQAIADVMPGMPDKIFGEGVKLLKDMVGNGFNEGVAIDIKESLKRRLAQIALLNLINEEFGDDELQHFIDEIYSPFRSTAMFGALVLFPRLAAVSPFSRYLETNLSNYEKLRMKLGNCIKRRMSTISKSEDIVSEFCKDKPDPVDEDIAQLTGLSIDWIFAGTSTCAEQILWVLLLLLKHPDILSRVKEEIRSALGNKISIVELYQNQELVPLLQASIHETMRLRPIAPMALFHKTTKDSVIGGFKIPKDVVVVPNLWSVHHDPAIWSPDPEAFRPERHLDKDRNFVPSEYVIPFSMGGRRCAGEKLARANIFIFTALLLSRCDLELAPDDVHVDMEGEMKAILQTPNFKILKRERKSK